MRVLLGPSRRFLQVASSCRGLTLGCSHIARPPWARKPSMVFLLGPARASAGWPQGFREGPRGKLAKRETCSAWFSRYVRLVRDHFRSIPRLQSDCVTVLIWPHFPFSSDSCALKVSSWKDGTHTRKLDFVWSFCGYFLEALRHSSTTEGVTGCKLLLKFIRTGDDDKELTELTLGVRHMEQAQRNSPQALRSMAPA